MVKCDLQYWSNKFEQKLDSIPRDVNKNMAPHLSKTRIYKTNHKFNCWAFQYPFLGEHINLVVNSVRDVKESRKQHKLLTRGQTFRNHNHLTWSEKTITMGIHNRSKFVIVHAYQSKSLKCIIFRRKYRQQITQNPLNASILHRKWWSELIMHK
jgi:hypothetical protein